MNSEHSCDDSAALVPKWDSDRRVLSVAGVIVKRFTRLAKNQQAILAAFEEEGWPAGIDDPLSPVPEIDNKHRLHDTIRSLNRRHCQRLICFRSNGTGESVIWEAVQ